MEPLSEGHLWPEWGITNKNPEPMLVWHEAVACLATGIGTKVLRE